MYEVWWIFKGIPFFLFLVEIPVPCGEMLSMEIIVFEGQRIKHTQAQTRRRCCWQWLRPSGRTTAMDVKLNSKYIYSISFCWIWRSLSLCLSLFFSFALALAIFSLSPHYRFTPLVHCTVTMAFSLWVVVAIGCYEVYFDSLPSLHICKCTCDRQSAQGYGTWYAVKLHSMRRIFLGLDIFIWFFFIFK